MKSIIVNFFLLTIALFCLISTGSYGRNYYANIENINIKNYLLIGNEASINCDIDISIRKDDVTPYDRFWLYGYNSQYGGGLYNENGFIENAGVIDNKEFSGDRQSSFWVNNDGLQKNLRLRITCNLVILDIVKAYNNCLTIPIGIVNKNTIEDDSRDLVLLNVCCDENIIPKPQPKSKIKVVEDLDLGRTYSGGVLDSRNDGAHPAIIEISGDLDGLKVPFGDKGLKLQIKNKEDDALDVNIWIKEIRKKRDLMQLVINGRSKTNKYSKGKYEGSFVVRLEYEV